MISDILGKLIMGRDLQCELSFSAAYAMRRPFHLLFVRRRSCGAALCRKVCVCVYVRVLVSKRMKLSFSAAHAMTKYEV